MSVSFLITNREKIMTSKNDITGDLIKSKSSSENYRNNYDLIFNKNKNENEKPSSNTCSDSV